MSGRRVAILRALVRPNLILHCDRELFLLWVGATFGIGFRFGIMEGSVEVVAGALVTMLLGVLLIAHKTKQDPLFRTIWLRTVTRYARSYFARPRFDQHDRRTRA